MKKDIYNGICREGSKQFAILIDPEQCREAFIRDVVTLANTSGVDYILVGGSLLVNDHLSRCLRLLRSLTDLPLVLFPGSEMQINANADAILLLSLISGRNPELLIGKHVSAAPYLRDSGLEIIPTGYMLIESGNATTALYMSNTMPIPREKDDIAVCTAMAGEMLGLRLLYLDAGSGAARPVPLSMISRVSEEVSLPIMVGGGITTPEIAANICRAGADIIVVGTAIEKDLAVIPEIAGAIRSA